MTLLIRRGALVGACLAFVLLGCATKPPVQAEAVPAHPFPRWVSHLETGVTEISEIQAVFGAPIEIEQHRGGGLAWRYAYSEVHWAANDPDRPQVAADGRPVEAPPLTIQERVLDGLKATGEFLDQLLYYPPRQPAGPKMRTMPVTRHRLELVFDGEGVLERFLYSPQPDRARVAIGR